MWRWNLLLWGVWLCFAAPAYAQNVLITVLQKGTGEPVAGANVVVIGTEKYVVTGENGQAQLAVEEPAPQVKILAVGYETLVAPLNPVDGKVTYYIEPVSVDSTGFDVVADRLPEKISKISMSAQELAHAPGSQGDPIIAAQSLPGVVTAEDGSGQVYMRGSDIYDNNTFVNRVPIGYLYHFGGLRSTINPQLISDLNIFLGGFPVAYGDKLGGVFDVQLREPRADRQRYHFDISTIEANFIVEGPAGSSSNQSTDGYYFAARRSYIDLILSPSDFTDLASSDNKSEEETNQFISVPEYYDIQGLYRHPMHNGYLDYYYFAASDKTAFENREGVKTDPQIAGDTISEQTYHTLGLSWKAKLDTQWKVDMPVAFVYQKSSLQLGSDDSGNPFYANSEQENLIWLPQLTFQHDDFNQYMFGFDAGIVTVPLDLYISRPPLEEDVYFNITDQNKYRVKDTIHAREFDPYFQYRRHWSGRWTSILGLRYSYIDGSGDIAVRAFSPRLALEYQYTPETLLTASWGRYVQLPHGFELLDGFGNPGLEYTEAEHRILGVEHKVSSLWSVKAEIYQKPMDNLVVSIDNQTPPDNYENLGEGDAYGLDLFLKRQRHNGVMGWISYSYAHTERFNPLKPQVGDRNFSGDQPHSLTLVWSQPFNRGPFDWMQSWKRWTWGVKLQAHSGKPYTKLTGRHLEDPADPNSRYIPEFAKHNADRTPAYYRLDLRLERDFLSNTRKMKFYIDILNVTNHKNIVGYDYGSEFEKFNNPDEATGLPFYPYIGFELDF
jgi:outer membrane receptor protein involved in Fe transport